MSFSTSEDVILIGISHQLLSVRVPVNGGVFLGKIILRHVISYK